MRASVLCICIVVHLACYAAPAASAKLRALGKVLLSAALFNAASVAPSMEIASAFAATHPSQSELAEVLRFVREDAADYAAVIESSGSYERLDVSDDAIFYSTPRFVEHIDSGAVKALGSFYEREFQRVAQSAYGDRDKLLSILDLCASHSSHFPDKYRYSKESRGGVGSRVVGVGMNKQELDSNPAMSAAMVQDLNKDPRLAFEDGSFDIVTIQLSIDYLTRPTEVLREARRVLKKGSGEVIITFSNRMFMSKVTAAWSSSSDLERLSLVCAYLEAAGFPEGGIVVADLAPRAVGDPLYAVIARGAI